MSFWTNNSNKTHRHPFREMSNLKAGLLKSAAGLLLTTVCFSANALTSVTIWNEAFGNNASGRTAAATLDDSWAGSLTYGVLRPDLFSGAGTHTGSLTFTDSVSASYQVDWQVGYINTLGPGIPTSTDFVNVTSGTVTKGTSNSIQSGAPNPYPSEVRLSTGYSAFALNAVKLDFNSSATNITEFGFFIGDLESRVNNGTAGRVIVFDTSGGLLADTPIQFTGTVLNGTNYDASDPLGSPTGAANNPKGSWGNSTTAFISVQSDQAIGEVIIQVGDDDHTSNNNGSSEQLGLAGFQIPDNMIVVPVTADLSVTKTLNTTGPFTSGQTITYTIVVTNSASSAATATNVQVEDLSTNLSNLVISSATTCPTGSVSAGVICTITSLAPGATETITLTATVP